MQKAETARVVHSSLLHVESFLKIYCLLREIHLFPLPDQKKCCKGNALTKVDQERFKSSSLLRSLFCLCFVSHTSTKPVQPPTAEEIHSAGVDLHK